MRLAPTRFLPFLALFLAGTARAAEPAPGAAVLSRTFKLEHRYLNIPIKNGAPQRELRILIDGRLELTQVVELADAKPDWWAFLDTGSWLGRELTVEVPQLPPSSGALAQMESADQLRDAANFYRENLRPQFHFSSRRGWINDPNGLVYYRGEYHLFYQHDPFSWRGANLNKHWGHAVSADLVHWHELSDALAPDALGAIYSGSAIVDWMNSSGFGAPGRPAQVLVYTAAGPSFGQCLAFSGDGRTYTKYTGNPVVREIMWGNRDPKVIWYAPGKAWIMSLYVGPNKAVPDARGRPAVTPANTIQFLSSSDLRHWHRLGSTPGFFECPNLFELALDGDPTRKKWILCDAGSDYMIGRFDGVKFVPETPKLQGQSGQHVSFYAAQVFNDIPDSDGRCIQIGWLTAPSPGMPFNQTFSMPMELRLVTIAAGPRMTWTPVREMERLRARTIRLGPIRIGPGTINPIGGLTGELLEVRAEFAPEKAARIAFTVRGIPIVYDAALQEIVINSHAAAAPLINGRQSIAIYIDRTTLEVFASGGLTYAPVPVIADPKDLSLALSVQGGTANFAILEAHCLRSIWQREGGR